MDQCKDVNEDESRSLVASFARSLALTDDDAAARERQSPRQKSMERLSSKLSVQRTYDSRRKEADCLRNVGVIVTEEDRMR